MAPSRTRRSSKGSIIRNFLAYSRISQSTRIQPRCAISDSRGIPPAASFLRRALRRRQVLLDLLWSASDKACGCDQRREIILHRGKGGIFNEAFDEVVRAALFH